MGGPHDAPDTAAVPLGIDGLEGATEVGSGGFGAVYRARQTALDRIVAVKVLWQAPADQRSGARFERECKAMGVLSGHPHIVTIYDGGLAASGKPYILMEYLSQGSLADRVERAGRLAWAEVCDYGVKLAGALETAHQANILHRDVKPANVLLSAYGEPKLGDFGIAQMSNNTVTQTAGIAASVKHAAPELFEGARASVRSDLYSLGSTLFALLAGRAAFERDAEDSFMTLLRRAVEELVPDLRPDGVPGDVCDVVERLMAKDPAQRFGSARELGSALQQLQRSHALQPTKLAVHEDLAASAAGSIPPAPLPSVIDHDLTRASTQGPPAVKDRRVAVAKGQAGDAARDEADGPDEVRRSATSPARGRSVRAPVVVALVLAILALAVPAVARFALNAPPPPAPLPPVAPATPTPSPEIASRPARSAQRPPTRPAAATRPTAGAVPPTAAPPSRAASTPSRDSAAEESVDETDYTQTRRREPRDSAETSSGKSKKSTKDPSDKRKDTTDTKSTEPTDPTDAQSTKPTDPSGTSDSPGEANSANP